MLLCEILNGSAMADGNIPVKYKELIAVAHSIQCPCCGLQKPNNRKQGAGDAELVEAVKVNAAFRASGPVIQETHWIKEEKKHLRKR